jgi:MoxR-like ATPase
MQDLKTLQTKIEAFHKKIEIAKSVLGTVIVSQKQVIEALFQALFTGGHLLIEGMPGLGKTLICKTFADVTNLNFKRIQFTPDLLPADLIGTTVFNPKEVSFSINKGPVFTNLLLADEINRAPAKVQSALLEVMQEKQVTISGETLKTDTPYMVLATQNPIESEGVYPLPEAQLDRFMMKILIDYPNHDEEIAILKRMITQEPPKISYPSLSKEEIEEGKQLVADVFVDDSILDYIVKIANNTRKKNPLLLSGVSPRASLTLKLAAKSKAFLNGRAFVTPNDVKSQVIDVFRHRVRISFEAEAEGLTSDEILKDILNKIPVP